MNNLSPEDEKFLSEFETFVRYMEGKKYQTQEEKAGIPHLMRAYFLAKGHLTMCEPHKFTGAAFA
jgi:hypothetical protein